MQLCRYIVELPVAALCDYVVGYLNIECGDGFRSKQQQNKKKNPRCMSINNPAINIIIIAITGRFT